MDVMTMDRRETEMSLSVPTPKTSWNGSFRKAKKASRPAELSPKKIQVGESAAGIPDRQLPLYLKEIGQVSLLDP